MSKNDVDFITLKKPNIFDFAMERNLALKKATSKWIFFVDGDEVISDDLMAEIRIIASNASQIRYINAYYIKRDNYFLSKYVGTDNIIRLIKKGSGKWQRAVHEVFSPHFKSVHVGQLKNRLIHKTASNLYDYISKINSYSKIHASENLSEGKSSNLIKIVFYPTGKFIYTLMKSKNIVFSIMQSFHSFLSWSQMWLDQRNV